MSFLKDLWGFIKARKKWWLLPLIIFLLIIGLLLIIGGNTALAPFIYTIF
jgi:competence protein ComGC